MIALAPWYAKVPKDSVANRQWRFDVLREAADSRKARDWLKSCCAEDIYFWINGFTWTFDPRLKDGDKLLPLISWADQDELLRVLEYAIEAPRDLVVEKARDRGASWFCLAKFAHRWQFYRDQTFMVISRDADEVDKPGYPDALFYKIDILHKYQPAWLMPTLWRRQKFMCENLDAGNTINGEATVEGAGVGGRRTAMLFDEL